MNVFYDGSFFDLTPENFLLIDVAARSFGRTSYWLNRAVKRAIKSPVKRFIYLRRSQAEMDEVINNGFCKNMLLTSYYGDHYRKNGYTIEVNAGKAYAVKNGNKTLIGYLKTLNNVKGIDLDDVDLIIFDEFIALMRNQYKGGAAGTREPILFDRFIHTVFRRRTNCHVILLGNQDSLDSPTNPYNEFYKIPFKAKKFRRKDIRLMYRHWDGAGDVGSSADLLSLADAETYAKSVKGDICGITDEMFIVNKTPRAEYLCGIKHQKTYLTVWIDGATGILYVHSNYAVDKYKPYYTAFKDDMTVETSLLMASQFPQLKAIKQKFYTNQIRYDTQLTATKFNDIIDLIKG